jgi:hypothetical protein
MKQYSADGETALDEFKDISYEWAEFFLTEFVTSFLSFIWVAILSTFSMFIFTFVKNYYCGYIKGDKRSQLQYNDMDKIARQVVFGFVLFIICSVTAISNIEGFPSLLFRGVVIGAVVFPIANNHFGDEKSY